MEETLHPVVEDNNLKGIPKSLHFVYLNDVPRDLLFGGKKLVGLRGVCKKAQSENYQVNMWVRDVKAFAAQIADARDDFPGLKIRALSSLDVFIEKQFIDSNGFDDEFSEDLKFFIESEEEDGRNLAAASNILRLLILASEGGIYCDLSKTFSKNINPNSFLFDDLLKKTRFGFIQKERTNQLLISKKMHTVVLETLRLVVRNYRLSYKVSNFNSKAKDGDKISVEVLKSTRDNYLTFIQTEDPVGYAHSLTNKDYREAATELLSGVYPLGYGLMMHFLQTLTQNGLISSDYEQMVKNQIHDYMKDKLHCLKVDHVYGFQTNRIFKEEYHKKAINMGLPTCADDYSIKKSSHPLAQFREDFNAPNWRELPKQSHVSKRSPSDERSASKSTYGKLTAGAFPPSTEGGEYRDDDGDEANNNNEYHSTAPKSENISVADPTQDYAALKPPPAFSSD